MFISRTTNRTDRGERKQINFAQNQVLNKTKRKIHFSIESSLLFVVLFIDDLSFINGFS
jgi:hypothetical protein